MKLRRPRGTQSDPPVRARRRHALRSLWWRHRPVVAGALAFVLVLVVLPLFTAPTNTSPVLVATRDLAAGHVVAAGDVRVVGFPVDLAPGSALADPALAVGHQLRHGVAARAPLVASSLVDDGWGLGAAEAAVPVRFADPLLSELVEPGDVLELVRADGEATASLTGSARVLALVADTSGGGLLGDASARSHLVLLAVPRTAATLVLDASAQGTLTAALASASV